MNNLNKYCADKILEALITEYKKLELCKLNIWDAFLLFLYSLNN
jgi:hypothetical protein